MNWLKTIQKDGTIRMSQSLNKVASTIKTEVEDKSGIIVTNETNSTTKMEQLEKLEISIHLRVLLSYIMIR